MAGVVVREKKQAILPARVVFYWWLLASVVLLVTAAVMIWGERRQQLRNIENHLSALNLILAEQTARSFQSVDLLLLSVAERLESAGYPQASGSLNAEFINDMLESSIIGARQMRSLFVVNTQGRVAYTALRTPAGMDLSDRRYVFAQHNAPAQARYIDVPLRNRVDDTWSVFVSRRLVDWRGEYAGVAVASIPFAYFKSIYTALNPRELGACMVLFRHDGVVLYGEPFDEAQLGANSKLFATVSGQLQSRSADRQKPVVVRMETGWSDSVEPQLVTLHAAEETGLYTMITVRTHDALAAWRSYTWKIGTWMTAIFVLLTLAIFTLTRELRSEASLKSRLLLSRARFQDIISSVMDAIITVNEEGKIVLFNSAAEKLLGYRAEEVLGGSVERFIPRRFGQQGEKCIADWLGGSIVARTHAESDSIVAVCKDGREIAVDASISPLQSEGQSFYTAVLRDITQRLAYEEELERLNQQLREYSDALQSVREQERAHIARELHDDLGQQLTGIRLGVSALLNKLRQGQPQLSERLGPLVSQIDMAIASVRRIGAELRPLMLDDLGLCAAVEWLAGDVQDKTGLQIQMEMDEENEPELDDKVASALFRIVQESLHNVVRHAQARHVQIRLVPREGGMWMQVKDDGIGVRDVTFSSRGAMSLGLIGIRERIYMLGGKISIESGEGKGFTLEVWVPMTPPKDTGCA